ncbi:unnamed protein product [Paramecium octaurelia]|uniref:Transmembrane protein n=1 Tax=Paramecium octaurelia TaxID=43137 RepID=A0A8S1RXN7_PAROT|nr:unnamed protein product [Paramecium octaurelia]
MNQMNLTSLQKYQFLIYFYLLLLKFTSLVFGFSTIKRIQQWNSYLILIAIAIRILIESGRTNNKLIKKKVELDLNWNQMQINNFLYQQLFKEQLQQEINKIFENFVLADFKLYKHNLLYYHKLTKLKIFVSESELIIILNISESIINNEVELEIQKLWIIIKLIHCQKLVKIFLSLTLFTEYFDRDTWFLIAITSQFKIKSIFRIDQMNDVSYRLINNNFGIVSNWNFIILAFLFLKSLRHFYYQVSYIQYMIIDYILQLQQCFDPLFCYVRQYLFMQKTLLTL